MDPTFTQQFGMAAQSDILRRAGQDRHHRQALSSADAGQHMGRVSRLIARLRFGRRAPCAESVPAWRAHENEAAA